MESLIHVLAYIVVVCLILGLVVYAADAIPIPEPFNRLIKIAATVIGVLIICLLLLRVAGVAGAV